MNAPVERTSLTGALVVTLNDGNADIVFARARMRCEVRVAAGENKPRVEVGGRHPATAKRGADTSSEVTHFVPDIHLIILDQLHADQTVRLCLGTHGRDIAPIYQQFIILRAHISQFGEARLWESSRRGPELQTWPRMGLRAPSSAHKLLV